MRGSLKSRQSRIPAQSRSKQLSGNAKNIGRSLVRTPAMHLSRRNIIAAVLGAFYGKELSAAELAGRICKVDVNRDLPILTAWDLGVDDPTAIWVFQVEPGRVNAIDYYESSGHGLSHYVDWLNENNYRGVDWVPHDARVREFGSGRTRIEAMLKLGRKPRLVPAHSVMDGINAARQTIPCTYFDATRCAKGLEALREYKAEFDDDLRTFKKVPKHDWSSHAADAFRYLAMAWREPMQAEDEKPDAIAEMLKPKTLDQAWEEYTQEQIDQGADPDEFKPSIITGRENERRQCLLCRAPAMVERKFMRLHQAGRQHSGCIRTGPCRRCAGDCGLIVCVAETCGLTTPT
jgi:hypothetical protein